MFWDRSTAHSRHFFISSTHFNAKFPHKQPTNFWAVTAISYWVKRIKSIRSQALGPIKRPFKASSQSKHRKILKMGIKHKYGETHTSWILSKLTNPGSTRSLLHVERFPFLLRRNPTVRLPRILERMRTFSH